MKYYLKIIEQLNIVTGFIVACENIKEVDAIIEPNFHNTSVLSGRTYVYEISERNADEHGVGKGCNCKCVIGYHFIKHYMKELRVT